MCLRSSDGLRPIADSLIAPTPRPQIVSSRLVCRLRRRHHKGCIDMSNLFNPIHVGAFDLSHRIVLAPLTRMRAEMPGNIPGQAMADYYAARATPGGFLIAEATYVPARAMAASALPASRPTNRSTGWKNVVDAVHAKGATIVLQLWHVGRVSHASLQPDGGLPVAPPRGTGMAAFACSWRASQARPLPRARSRPKRSRPSLNSIAPPLRAPRRRDSMASNTWRQWLSDRSVPARWLEQAHRHIWRQH